MSAPDQSTGPTAPITLAGSNTDQTSGTDRQAVGPQQDNATPTGNPPVTGGSASYLISKLPSAGTAGIGARTIVTDSQIVSFSFSTVGQGGGTNTVPVYSDGSVWRIG